MWSGLRAKERLMTTSDTEVTTRYYEDLTSASATGSKPIEP